MSTNAGNDGHGAFELPDATDVYIAASPSLSPDQCAAQTAREPARVIHLNGDSIVPFTLLPPGLLFCLRSRRSGEIAVIRVIDTDDGNYAAKIAVDYYQHRG